MSPKKPTSVHLDEAKTIEALTSPLRIEILQAFTSAEERLSVRDLAERLGKPRGSLYYHVRKLADIGVLVEVDRELRGKKYESYYEVAADRLVVGGDANAESTRSAMIKLVSSLTRQVGREFERSLEEGAIGPEDAGEVGRRQRAWLTPDDVAKLEELLAQMEAICTQRKTGEGARLYSLTSFLVPLEPPSED